MEIKTVQFDLGRVLVDFDWYRAAAVLRSHCRLSAEEIVSICSNGEHSRLYELGRISSDEFFDQLGRRLGVDDPFILRSAYSDIFTALSDHADLPRRLRDFYHIGLISNTCEAHVGQIENQFSFMADLHTKTYSFEIGIMKPDAEIYHAAVEGLGCAPDEVLFIDDLESNIRGAAALGWQVIHCRKGENLTARVRDLGLRMD